MSALFATASVPGTLYVGGRPAGTPGKYPLRAEYDGAGEHILFMPHVEGFLPIAREICTLGEDAPHGAEGLSAILWPGGTLEMTLCPARAEPPETAATAPFLQSVAALRRSQGVFLEAEGLRIPVGDGPECGLRELPGGWLAAFAQQGEGEALVIAAPGLRGMRNVLSVRGEQVLLSQEGDRVRVHEFMPPGAMHHTVREYEREGDAYRALPPSVVPSANIPTTPYELACALSAAAMLGAYGEALSMLSPSLRAVTDAETLRSFFGTFDSYTAPRHTVRRRGTEMLALLSPKNGAHIARPVAFTISRGNDGKLEVENINIWE